MSTYDRLSNFVASHSWLMGVDPKATGRELAFQRKRHNLTQQQLSDLIDAGGLSASAEYICTVEHGKETKAPSLSLMCFLACLYQVSLDDLVVTYAKSQKDDAGNDPVVPLQITLAA